MDQSKNTGEASARETQWAAWMRAALAGDEDAYRRLLEALVPVLRRIARQGLRQAGAGNADAEDVVQEVLLAIHLKRHTWIADQPFSPWLNAIARYKLIDVLRRRGRRGEVPVDDLVEVLPDQSEEAEASPRELEKLVGRLQGRERDAVVAISLEGRSVRDAALKFSMSEGAIRVALHRGLKRLARLYRSEDLP